MLPTSLQARLLVFVLAVPAAGCGSTKLVPVRGAVKLDGRPLANATVLFISQEAEGRDARATTDAEGVFRLSTFDPNDGAYPGKYKVVIQSAAEADGLGSAATPLEAQQPPGTGRARTKPGPAAVPQRYTRPDQTPLEHRVPEDGDLKLELNSEGR
jgi:hypothetical protein